MRELNLFSAGDLRWVERPDPTLQLATDAIVRPIVVSRCDGDSLPINRRVSRAMQAGLRVGALDPSIGHICGPVPFKGPFAIGHECVAEIVELGSAISDFAVGDRVVVPWSVSCGECATCRRGLTSKCEVTRGGRDGTALAAYGFGPASGSYGGMVSDLLRVPFASHMLVKVPAGLDPLRVAAASDNLADAWRCVVPPLQALPGARVLVVAGGARSIGLYAAGLAVAHGASRVDYLDSDPARRGIAEEFGAHAADRDRRMATRRSSYDIVVEATSNAAGMRYAIRAAAPGAFVTGVGYYVAANTAIPLMHMYAADVTLHLGVSHPRPVLPQLLDWMATNDFAADKVIDVLGDFDDAPRLYGQRATKVVLQRD